MRRMIWRWAGLAVVLTLLALLAARLGEWQLDRLEQRREANAVIVANEGLAPVDWAELMGGEVRDDDAWRRVTLRGTYTGEQFQVRYRNFGGGPGIEVAAILRTVDGAEVLVNRGFIPRQQGRPDTEVLPPTPAGEVSVLGYVHRDERGDDTAVVPHDHKVRLINAGAIGAALGRELVPGYVVLISSDPANGEDLLPITPPELTEGNHLSYALQWFTFGIIGFAGIFVLIRSDLKDMRRARARAALRRADRTASEVGDDAAD